MTRIIINSNLKSPNEQNKKNRFLLFEKQLAILYSEKYFI